MFAVKSAYKLGVNRLVDTSGLHVQGDWSMIRNLELPPVVKKFVRRMLQDCLPTILKLATKGTLPTPLHLL